MSTAKNLLDALPPEGRARLLDQAARVVSLPVGTRIFEEGRKADHFWIIRSGQVELDLHVPGRRAVVIETLGRDELLGWSWLFPPRIWHLGAAAIYPVEAVEFDAAAVCALCDEDAELGRALYRYVAETVAARLRGTRTRLLALYGPQSGNRADTAHETDIGQDFVDI
ncbi:cyclic nucleotide-binding domain-containing protein [Streptomyces sp. NPDC058232]|uniref:cyclic nucleotide-binding domain-containing protein n=1 Tax=Streptomyces TaxID=1883 RepID=UPI0028C478B3|nr:MULTISPECIES: cyclic nucleotide-binding domain-containing protein [unclassified Streptomyces]WTE55539.1 cyclic nucleotide-binding domain-containing protein [Streptomyces sp. NBC_01620]WTE63602.1 cyclic nucleotide-binding domain-containing protein [Streptomyces sp. NBC_01617]WTI90888.1 cyclic nucleotide-binding domain-containing protein [Streptomyces sp. NBC_00724]WNO68502.1 cyclic nucleotide-binding domain-containing protein [Streptomyces sp. AM2-3-1]WSC73157.1 cyclic nucleotide-binding dom